jgi:hypothetical protein
MSPSQSDHIVNVILDSKLYGNAFYVDTQATILE